MDKIILITYFNSDNISGEYYKEIREEFRKMAKNEYHKGIIHYLFFLPNVNTRVECINPKLISKEEFEKVQIIIEENERLVNDFLEKY